MTALTSVHYPSMAAGFEQMLVETVDQRLVVVAHARPDGDCIGAQVALARVLRALGRDAVCCNPDPVPRRLKFSLGDTPFVSVDDVLADNRKAIFVDCADLGRAGDRLQTHFPNPFANVDHHMTNQGYAAHNFVDSSSAATCEILAGLFTDLNLPIDPVTAGALYLGIATDTGQFRFQATTRRTFDLTARLVALGADPAQTGIHLYEQESFGKLQLLQRFLASFETYGEGRICVGVLPLGIYEETGTSPEDTEGLVDYARAIEGVEIGCLIEEKKDGIKASLRAMHPEYRVDQVALRFSGGGHACAAGINVKNISMAEFRRDLLAALTEQVQAVQQVRLHSK